MSAASIGFGIAAFCFTVVIPTVVTQMMPTIEPFIGWVIIAISAGVGISSAVISFAQHQKRQESKSRVPEPVHLIALGLVIALVGVGWQLFASQKASPPVQGNEVAGGFFHKGAPPAQAAPETKPYYSPDDKDRISRMLNKLSDVLTNQAKPMELAAQKIRQAWENARADNRFEVMGILVEKLEQINKQASDVQHAIYTDLTKEFHREGKLLRQIVSPEKPTIVTEFQQEVRNMTKQLEHALVLSKHLPKDDPNFVPSMDPMLRILREATAQLNNWIDQSQKRIKQVEHDILGR